MDFKGLKFGYVPLTADLKGPGDRRRFVSWAKARNIDFEIADWDKIYDVVYLTYKCDTYRWIQYKKQYGNNSKLIYELVDSYLFENPSLKTRLRGLGKFLTGSSTKLYWDFKKGIYDICRIADGVVCSTIEQKTALRQFNDNVHISLDVFDDDIKAVKENFETGEKLRLVWEGQPYTIENLLSIKNVLNDLASKIELHLVTDEYYYAFSKQYIKRKTLDILKPLKCPVILHPWDRDTFSENICAQDLAIIPINLSNRFSAGKPENKLILFWLSNMPALVSATPAYKRVMDKSGVNMVCNNEMDWRENLLKYTGLTADERKQRMIKGRNYAIQHYNRHKLYDDWDRLFASVLG